MQPKMTKNHTKFAVVGMLYVSIHMNPILYRHTWNKLVRKSHLKSIHVK